MCLDCQLEQGPSEERWTEGAGLGAHPTSFGLVPRLIGLRPKNDALSPSVAPHVTRMAPASAKTLEGSVVAGRL